MIAKIKIALTASILLFATFTQPSAETRSSIDEKNTGGYEVQVGDVIRLSLPGEESLDKSFSVDRRGLIHLPEVGAIKVSGQKERQLTNIAFAALSPVFQDLSTLKVYVIERKRLVNVLGYVNQPGEISVPAGSSFQAILAKAGGLRSGAQLDKIQLRRQGNVSAFDYKLYLDTGDTSAIPDIKSLDTVFIPASPKIGNVEVEFDPAKFADSGDASNSKQAIKVFGEVNSPGSFTYVDAMTIVDLLMRAGGVTRYAGVEHIRVISGGDPILFDLKRYLDTGEQKELPSVAPGATIFVPRQEESVKSSTNTVYVMGEVFEPGAYESADGVTFLDILANAGGPTRYAETRQIRVLKVNGAVEKFDLAAFTEGLSSTGTPSIQAGDAIFVPEKTDMNEKSWLKIAPNRAVRVIGEVVRPGRVEWSDEMSFLDLLAHVGGPVARADTSNIEINYIDAQGRASMSIFNLDTFLKEGHPDSALPRIAAGTTIRVHDLPQDPSDNKSQWVRQSSEKSIYIFGQVGAPGRYMFKNDMNFLDILAAADGPTMDADIHNVRITHRNKDYALVTKLNLAQYFETGDESLLPDVKTGDSIYIPEKKREWTQKSKESTVRVLGEVHKQGRYTFTDDMTILDLLAQAGGPTGDAYVKKILVVNVECCSDEARRFNLVKFSKTGDFSKLPVLRAGDTVYIPSKSDSNGNKVRKFIGDTFKVISLGLLLGI